MLLTNLISVMSSDRTDYLLLASLTKKLKFLPTGIGISTFRRDENWPVTLLDIEIPIPVGRKFDYKA